MLGRLILILLQAIIGWFAAREIAGYIHLGHPFDPFIFAIICAIIVFLVGVVASLVLRDIGQPGSSTLTWALVCALIAAAIAMWGPMFVPQISRIPDNGLILAGAILGYLIKR